MTPYIVTSLVFSALCVFNFWAYYRTGDWLNIVCAICCAAFAAIEAHRAWRLVR